MGLAMLGVAGPAGAQCATEGLRVKCIYVGPNEDGNARGSEIISRFVTVPEREVANEETDRDSTFKRIMARRNKVPEPTFSEGDTLPADVLVLMNPLRYGLPRPRDGWTYFSHGSEIYRAILRSRRVLDYVNPHISRR
ncbi:hypothetical protein OB2597_01217 [Pseudooceanicola batsensis HTCC2597]|uniref:Uncharacterized protein n=1 Tax=Pseudooceanicola batsensis (strain ATCC BAA-863 / DSM 15984 / KCTC 12145 / HTCC2597) TaxID=252305 RepID=A3U2T6_PSEBH|nr:hypothetical protein OB2597_01217 [Pseudooceanicola batsensis HTCC2597]